MLEGPTAALFLVVACLACWAGMGWLALAMDGHWEQVFQAEQPQRVVWRLRAQGAAGLALGSVMSRTRATTANPARLTTVNSALPSAPPVRSRAPLQRPAWCLGM